MKSNPVSILLCWNEEKEIFFFTLVQEEGTRRVNPSAVSVYCFKMVVSFESEGAAAAAAAEDERGKRKVGKRESVRLLLLIVGRP